MTLGRFEVQLLYYRSTAIRGPQVGKLLQLIQQNSNIFY